MMITEMANNLRKFVCPFDDVDEIPSIAILNVGSMIKIIGFD